MLKENENAISTKDFAKENGIDLFVYKMQNVVVTQKTTTNFLMSFFFLFVSVLFGVIAVIEKQSVLAVVICSVLSAVTFVCFVLFIADILTFKIVFNNGDICARVGLKKYSFNLTQIDYFSAEHSAKSGTYEVKIVAKNVQLKYEISYTNKNNFVFLLNLAKAKIPQK